MAMLNILILNENRNSAMISERVVSARPISSKLRALTIKAAVRGILLSNFDTSQPDNGSPIRELTGMVNRIEPNSASFSCSAALIVGILDAQLEKLKPERKKKALRNILCVFNECITLK